MECPEAVPGVARIMREAWPEWYGPDGQGDARADLAERARAQGLPWAVVARIGGVPVGVAGLRDASHGAEPGEDCWLVGLATAPEWRGRGVASALVRAAVDAAEAPFVYATTVTAEGLLVRMGWQRVRVLADGHVILRVQNHRMDVPD